MSDLDLSSAIDVLRRITPQLNEIIDRHNATVAATEETLQAIGVGLRAEVQFENHFEEYVNAVEYGGDDRSWSRHWISLLTYRRHSGAYRICVEVRWADPPGEKWVEKSFLPWEQLPRDVKLRAFPSLPLLVQEIGKEAQMLMAAAEEVERQIAADNAADLAAFHAVIDR